MGLRRILAAGAVCTALVVAGCARPAGTGGAAAPVGGSPAAAAAPHSDQPKIPLRTGEHFQYLSPPAPYTARPPAGATDEYRCFLMDPHLAEKAFLVGSEFLPDNPAIVHHAILFRVPPADVEVARRVDAGSPGDGWTCFSDAGIQRNGLRDSGWIGAWAPGGTERLIDARVGFELEAGSQIVMQVHYNLLATDGVPPGPDRSGVRLRLMDGSAGLAPLQTTLLPAPVELPCAPGESGALCDRAAAIADVSSRFGPEAGFMARGLSTLCTGGVRPGPTQHCDRKAPEDAVIYGVGGHMHLLGRSIRVELNPDTPNAKVLLDVPVYNFDDQSARTPQGAGTAKAGDTYRVTCTHDASLRGQLPQLRKLPPRYVVWGEGTADEMCLGIVVWAAPA